MGNQRMSNSDFEVFLKGTDMILSGKTISAARINAINIPGGKKYIQNCIFENGFELTQIDIKEELIFENCSFMQSDTHGYIIGINSGWLLINESDFRGELIFRYCKTSKVWIHGINICKPLRIENCAIRDFRLGGAGINNVNSQLENIYCNDSPKTQFSIRESTVGGTLNFGGKIPESIFIGNGDYTSVTLNNAKDISSLAIVGTPHLSSILEIKKLQLSSIALTGNIILKNLIINDLYIDSFSNLDGIFNVFKTKFINKVRITDSSLSNVIFNDVNFKNAKLSFDRTFLDKTVFANIIWPKGNMIYTTEEVDEQENKSKYSYLVRKEVYRQLKNNSKNSSNHIDALKFYRNEMNEYWKYIKTTKTESWANRLLIGVNKYVSDFGQNYWWPLAWLLGVHFILFMILFFTKFSFEFQFNTDLDFTFKSFELATGEFIRLINPVHKMSQGMDGFYVIIDMLMRISAGFFIYQFLRATRKFARL